MNKFIKSSLLVSVIFTATAVLNSCKKSFDNPPADVPATSMKANTTIKDLKARHTVPGSIDKIDSGSDIIIRGIVVGDDRSGNLYKTLVIQDSTGGIAVLINGTNLYTSYPIGREVFIKCNGLYISDYSNQIQLGGGIQVGTTPTLADIATPDNYITKGTLNNVVTPTVVTLNQLGTTMQDKYQNTLIKLENFKFDPAGLPSTYASPGVTSPSAASFDLRECSSSAAPSIELRTSNYCNFASVPLPSGIGSITAIYTVYTRFKQLTIRDTSDVKFNGTTCGSGGGGGGGTTGGLLNENFETFSTSTTVPFAGTGWQNISSPSENATKFFVQTFSGGSKFLKVSAFNSTQVATSAITSWIISPAVSLVGATAPKLSFSTSAGYKTGSFKVMVSTNYNSANPPTSATWTDLTAVIPTPPGTGFTPFTPSGSINLNAYIGQTIYVAYRYDVPAGTAKADIATYEIDNVVVTAN